MSGDARITGRIVIDPPVPWGELRKADYATDGYWTPRHEFRLNHPQDARLDVATAVRQVDDGEVTTYHAAGIVPCDGDTSARTVVEDVQRVVDAFGEGRTFSGHLDLLFPGYGELSRVVVRDGRAVELRPAILYPGDRRVLELIADHLRNTGAAARFEADTIAVELLDALTRKANHG